MKTTNFHLTNMGSFAGGLVADNQGFVTIHDSTRYEAATVDQLQEWAESGRTLPVRNAAQCELNSRELAEWQRGN